MSIIMDYSLSNGKCIQILKTGQLVEIIGDEDKCLLDYTNRRRVHRCEIDSGKSNEDRKMENEKEFESLCSKIEECSVSKVPLVQKAVCKRSLSASTTSSIPSASSSSTSCVNDNQHAHKDVEAFQKFLKNNGGHYGGWKEKDHLYFVKARSKYPPNKIAEIVNENFPDLTVEKIQVHDAWYKEYLRLRAANKRAVEEWKRSHVTVLKNKPKEEDITESRVQSAPVKRDPNMKQKIEIWKAQTLAAKVKRMEEYQKEEMKKNKEREEKQRIQEEKRSMVNRYREEKLSYEMAMNTAKELEELQVKKECMEKTAKLLKFFRYEDRRFTERQKAKVQQKQKGKEEIKPKSLVKAKRDPNRLLQPTLGWIHHIKKSEEVEGATPVYIHHLPKLRKPEWREGVTS